jgi:hypothetical protein
MSDNGPVLQQIANCLLRYDMTGHRIEIVDSTGRIALKLWSLPDPPGGFDITNPEHMIEVHNPTGVDFVPMPDNYEDAKEAGYE